VLFGPKGDGAVRHGNGHGRSVLSKVAAWFGDLWD